MFHVRTTKVNVSMSVHLAILIVATVKSEGKICAVKSVLNLSKDQDGDRLSLRAAKNLVDHLCTLDLKTEPDNLLINVEA